MSNTPIIKGLAALATVGLAYIAQGAGIKINDSVEKNKKQENKKPEYKKSENNGAKTNGQTYKNDGFYSAAAGIKSENRYDLTKELQLTLDDNISPEKRKQIRDKIFAFKLYVLKTEPMCGKMLMAIDVVEDFKTPKAATDGRKIYYNPAYFDAIGEDKYFFIILSQFYHILHGYCYKADGKNEELWSTACEFAANAKATNFSRRHRDIELHAMEDAPFIMTEGYYEKVDAEDIYQQMSKASNKYRLSGQPIHFIYVFRSVWKYDVNVRPVKNLILPVNMGFTELMDAKSELEHLKKWAQNSVPANISDECKFFSKVNSYDALSSNDQDRLDRIIEDAFNQGSDDKTVLRLMELLEANRKVVKEAFAICDNDRIDSFLRKCYYLKDAK
ncbi:DUF2201 family putative metallopeptidase [Butyrivibrio proteoclasticus]|uniref:DUF2201 family putative metallopeptidase n=1 Tax=Butyrivibrio proteoclasticus TaxID=43305 RepID=UPI0004796D11|nr:hypothetical protein [Butyrivibrio proteoclasticus]